MLHTLARRLDAILATAAPPCLDLKHSRALYRDIRSLDIDCARLYRWTIGSPPTAMCAHFVSQFIDRPEILASPEIFDVIKRFTPCEVIRSVTFMAGHWKDLDGHRLDVRFQCAKRAMELRPALSFDEVVALLGSFDALGGFTGRFGAQFLEEMLHRALFVLEEADVGDVPMVIPFLWRNDRQASGMTQSYVEAIAERVVDIVGGCEALDDPAVGVPLAYHTARITREFARKGWAHGQLREAFGFLLKRLARVDREVIRKDCGLSEMIDCVWQCRDEIEGVGG